MCQLFAMNSSHAQPVHRALAVFTDRGGRTGDHVDGWGVAFHVGERCRAFTDPDRASDSALAHFLRRHPLHATTVIAHVRKATHGNVERVNCHPFLRRFKGRTWSFSHNGKLVNYDPPLRGEYTPAGQTDSERAFCWILEQLDQRLQGKDLPHWEQVAPHLADLATQVGQYGEFNFTLTDGEALYALGATRLAWVSGNDTAHLHHGLRRQYRHPVGRHTIQVATVPLTDRAHWRAFAPGELMVFSRGRPQWSKKLVLPTPSLHDRAPGN